MTEAEFLRLFDQYHNMVYRLAFSYTRSAQDAEDIVQTVYLKLLDGKLPQQAGKEKAWLCQVTANACKDLLRSFWRKRAEPLGETLPFVQEDESELYSAVMALPAPYRAAVYLHYYEGYTIQESAAILKCSPSAVSMRLHRARNLLRSSLKEDNYGPLVSEDL